MQFPWGCIDIKLIKIETRRRALALSLYHQYGSSLSYDPSSVFFSGNPDPMSYVENSRNVDAPLPRFAANVQYLTWERKFKAFLRTKGLQSFYEVSGAPSQTEPDWLPSATTAAEMIKHVRGVAERRDLVPGLRHNLAEESIDSNMLAVWARHVERNRREIAKWEKDTEEWRWPSVSTTNA